jgi:hypothetical protein
MSILAPFSFYTYHDFYVCYTVLLIFLNEVSFVEIVK